MIETALFRLSSKDFFIETSTLRDGIRWGKQANFNQTPILNRSSPVITYSNSSPIVLSVTIEEYVTKRADRKLVIQALQSLTALTFPETPGTMPPTLCYVDMPGYDLFKKWACVVVSLECTSGLHAMYNADGYPMAGSASVSLMGVEVENVKASDVMKTKNFKQIAYRSQ